MPNSAANGKESAKIKNWVKKALQTKMKVSEIVEISLLTRFSEARPGYFHKEHIMLFMKMLNSDCIWQWPLCCMQSAGAIFRK